MSDLDPDQIQHISQRIEKNQARLDEEWAKACKLYEQVPEPLRTQIMVAEGICKNIEYAIIRDTEKLLGTDKF